MESILYVVAVPIGNSGDLTFRAKEILESVDVIACEDTRKARELFKRCSLQVRAHVVSHHSHNQQASAQGLLSFFQAGASIALISDAGTPKVSDPGFSLIKLCYEHGVLVVPIPGASALTTLLSVVPFAIEPLLFLGFLSPKSARRKNELLKYKDFQGCIVLLESVHRIEALLKDIGESLGNIEVFIGREMTKTYEEFFYGSAEQALVWAKNKKGEFCLALNLR